MNGAARDRTKPASAKPATHALHNLPASVTTFIGRDAERQALTARLYDPACRIVTITGVGGVGKTRLALETARALVATDEPGSQFAHGIYFVPLAPIVPAVALDEILAAAIADTIGFALSGSQPTTMQLLGYLRPKAMLLVLDNVEHLPAAAPFVATLLQHAPNLKVLATSRERLRLQGEWLFELTGLAAPAGQITAEQPSAQDSALRLFAERARMFVPDFALTHETMPAVIRICRLVAGLPLGIELAATWTRMFSCAEIADELARNFDFLDAATPDLPARHQSVRAVFAYSWRLLSANEQQALRRIAIFHGSFRRDAAAAIAGATLPLLALLIDKSLVRHVAVGASHGRYELLEVLRQYAAEELARSGEQDAVADCHAAYYLRLLADTTNDLRGPRQREALATIATEIDQIRAAWRRAIAQRDTAMIERAADGLFHFYDMRSWFAEGLDAFNSARQMAQSVDQTDEATRALGKVLAREGWFTFHLGRQRAAQQLLSDSLALLRSVNARAEMVFALNYLASVCSYLGDYAATQQLCAESLAITAALDDRYGRAVACNILGQAVYDQGDYAAARTWSQQSLALEQAIGNQWSIAYSLTTLGKVAYALGEYRDARRLFEQSLAIREETGDPRGMAICFNWLGDTAIRLGDAPAAAERYAQSLALFREIGNQWGMAAALISLGQLAGSTSHEAAAARLLGEALRFSLNTQSWPQAVTIMRELAPLVRSSGDSALADTVMELVETMPDDPAVYESYAEQLIRWSLGNGITLEQAIAEAAAPPNRSEAAAPNPQPTNPRRTYPAGLTAREVDVLRLVAQGMTDKEVADTLVLSTRTVSTHLTSIYGKLQVNSRSAATRFAVEHDLV